MPRRRPLVTVLALISGAAAVTACGTQAIKLDPPDRQNQALQRGAVLFAQRCGGCHTLEAAGTQGSATTKKGRERVDGPNFDQRKETPDQVVYAIRNGGFSGAIMPQNIVVGRDADDVALFLAKYSGRQATRPKSPGGKTQPPTQGGSRSSTSG